MNFLSLRRRFADVGLLVLHEVEELGLPARDVLDRDLVEVALAARVDRHRLVDLVERAILRLLEEFDHPISAIELELGRLVQLGPELGEGFQLAEGGEVEPEAAGHLLHRGDLGLAADPRDRDPDVDRRADAREEEVGLEVDLPVGDRDHVRRDVGRDLPFERLDDRERRERPARRGGLHDLVPRRVLLLQRVVRLFEPGDAEIHLLVDARGVGQFSVGGGRVGDDHVLVRELRRPFEEARVRVEDVARERLAARRAAEEEGEFPVGDGLLREVVVDAEGRLPLLVHEVLGHRAAGVGGEVRERGGVARAGGDDDGVVHRAVLPEDVDEAGGGRLLLGDRDVDADDAGPLLVEDGVDGDGGLAGLPVADDQLALAAADGGHGVDRLDAGLHRLIDRLAIDDPGGVRLDESRVRRLDRPLVVDRLAQGVDDPTDHRRADRDAEELARRGDGLPLADLGEVAEDDDADGRLLEVERQPLDAVLERDHLAVHHAGEAVNPGDPVADLEGRAPPRSGRPRTGTARSHAG